jgi:hypothetical protein
MSAKVEETINRINTHIGVIGLIIVNAKGMSIKSTMSIDQTNEYGQVISNFCGDA